MREHRVVEKMWFWFLIIAYFLSLALAVTKQGTDEGDIYEGIITIVIFLSTFFMLCYSFGDPDTIKQHIGQRLIPLWLDVVLILLNGFIGWYLGNPIIVVACLICLLSMKKVEAMRAKILAENSSSNDD